MERILNESKDQFINSHPLDDYIDHQTHDVSTQNVKQDFEQQFNEQDLKKLIQLVNKSNH